MGKDDILGRALVRRQYRRRRSPLGTCYRLHSGWRELTELDMHRCLRPSCAFLCPAAASVTRPYRPAPLTDRRTDSSAFSGESTLEDLRRPPVDRVTCAAGHAVHALFDPSLASR